MGKIFLRTLEFMMSKFPSRYCNSQNVLKFAQLIKGLKYSMQLINICQLTS